MSEKTLKPLIRFKGFTEAWEQRNWKDTVDISTEMVNPQLEQYKKLLHIGPGNIESFTGQLFDNVHTAEEDMLISGKFKFYIGDIIYGKINPQLGKYYYSDKNGLCSADSYVLRAKSGIKQKYLYSILQTANFYDYSVAVSMRSGMPKINRDELNSYSYLSPINMDEQSLIGDLLLKIDKVITLHQRKFEKLSQIKKSLLEKMFPAEGATTPKIRFKCFTEAWEQRKCSDISARFDNLRIPVAESKRVSGLTPYYGANGIQDYVEGYTHDGEFVLVAEDGANDLKNYPVQYVNGRIWVNNHAHVLQSNKENSTLFLKYLINSADIESVLVGGGRAKLNANVLMDLEFTVPKRIEQNKISMVLQEMDTIITLHQRKCEKLKNIKKSLLDRMFV